MCNFINDDNAKLIGFAILDGRIHKGVRLLDSTDSGINVRLCRFCSASPPKTQQVEYRFVLACIVEKVPLRIGMPFGVDLLSGALNYPLRPFQLFQHKSNKG